ncbi:MAG: transposase [Thermodesulfobacteriota bacterium]
MGRPLRIEYEGALYHITSRGNEKKYIYKDDRDKEKFLSILEDYNKRYGILVHSYVLMNNHYHLILETPRGNLLKIMHGLNSRYTGYFNKKHSRVGHLFQGRYKAILIDKENYLLELSRYVHLNPVRANIVEKPEDCKWSSYRGFIKNEEKEYVEYSWILSNYGKDKKQSKNGYRKYVEEALGEKLLNPLKNVFGQIILGNEEFINYVRAKIGERELSEDIIERKRLKEAISIERIREEVEKVIEAKDQRNVSVYLSKKYSNKTNREIAQEFGGFHYSNVVKIHKRIDKLISRDKQFKEKMRLINSRFKV